MNATWFWPTVILGGILWVVFVWKEWSNYPSGKFLLHIFLSFLAILALAIMALRPLKPDLDKIENMALLTEGYVQEHLDSLQKVNSSLVITNYTAGMPLFKGVSKPESVFVLGHGVNEYDLWQLDSVDAKYLKGIDLTGITKLHYSPQSRVGTKARFKGNYRNAMEGHKLFLESPSGVTIDSTILLNEKDQEFELSSDLKTSGKFLFQLIEKDSLNTVVRKDPLPISVMSENQLNIWIINEFPTFETKYLKNYLAKKGHQILVRSKLTNARYKFEYFNMTTRPSLVFSDEALKKLDLMIIDANSLNSLSRNSINAIRKAVRDNGLGIFIQPDQGFFASSNRLSSITFQGNSNVNTSLIDNPRIKLTTFPYKFRSDPNLQVIHSSSRQTLSAYSNYGRGRIGTSIIQNSYELVLKGQSVIYQELWSEILGKLSRNELVETDWSSNAQFVFNDEPMKFNIRTGYERPIIKTGDSTHIPMTQNLDISGLWQGITNPRTIGWKQLILDQDPNSIHDFYVANNTTWNTIRAYHTIMANERYFQDKKELKDNTLNRSLQLDPIWYFLLFMVCVGYLWLEPKL